MATKRIEVRKISDLPEFNSKKICVCPEVLCYEPLIPSRSEIKKALQISQNINDICVAFVHVGSKMFIMSDSCSFLHRFLLFNAKETQENGLKVYVKSTLSKEQFYKKIITFKSGEVI